MATWPEARAKAQERYRRDVARRERIAAHHSRRYYTAEMAGPRCMGGCGRCIPAASAAAGEDRHPTCVPEFAELLALAETLPVIDGGTL